MEEIMKITNNRGRNFNVRIVRIGERYGLDDCLTHGKEKDDDGDDAPMVEFYDATHEGDKFGPRGQFVSRYCIKTLLGLDNWSRGNPRNTGLDLMGYEPAWKIDAKAMNIVRAWLDNRTEGEL